MPQSTPEGLGSALHPEVADALSGPYERIVVFSGSGISAESGIPTFRSGSNGLWKDFNPHQLATPDAFARDPDLVWAWYEWRRGLIQEAKPNPGHLAAGLLQTALGAHIVTQNVDDLHERGGATDVMHLHGKLAATRCNACARPQDIGPPPPTVPERLPPPRCRHCGGRLRPGVVWFGEALPLEVMRRAEDVVQACDLLLVVGTSGVVQPAASIARMAPDDATVIVINPDPEVPGGVNRIHWETTAASALPPIAAALTSRAK